MSSERFRGTDPSLCVRRPPRDEIGGKAPSASQEDHSVHRAPRSETSPEGGSAPFFARRWIDGRAPSSEAANLDTARACLFLRPETRRRRRSSRYRLGRPLDPRERLRHPRLFRPARLETVRVPARGLGGDARGAQRPAARHHRRRQDARRSASARSPRSRTRPAGERRPAQFSGSRRCARSPPTPRARWKPRSPRSAPGSVGLRTGDTDDKTRAAQRKRLPDLLVTTPESLTLMLAHPDTRARFAALGDRRRRRMARAARQQARRADPARAGAAAGAGGPTRRSGACPRRSAISTARSARWSARTATRCIVRGKLDKTLIIDTLLPDQHERIPWGGHLGIEMLPRRHRRDRECRQLAGLHQHPQPGRDLVQGDHQRPARLGRRSSRCTTPRWSARRAIGSKPGSRSGALKAVVCTSSLDLGVDFLPVERVLQIGSPKGVARLLQRAGPLGPRARPAVAHHLRPEPQPGARRIRRRATRGARGADREPDEPRRAARRADAASRHHRARRRLPAGRTATPKCATPSPTSISAKTTGGGAWISCATAARPCGLSRFQARRAGQGRRLARAQRAARHAAPLQHRHDHRRRRPRRAIWPNAARRAARRRRGEFCRKAARRRQILVRRQSAGAHPGARDDGLCPQSQGRPGDRAALGRLAACRSRRRSPTRWSN